tara:strand:+ start:199 stop:483 length:285 start_codon:yes stop_codon:yes gene_type:complete
MGSIVLVCFFVVIGLGIFIAISKNDLGVKTFKNNAINSINNQNQAKSEAEIEEKTQAQEIETDPSIEVSPDIDMNLKTDSEENSTETNPEEKLN